MLIIDVLMLIVFH